MHKIDISFKPSKLFVIGVLLTIAFTLGILYSLPLHMLKKVLLTLPILTYGGYIFWDRALLQGGYSILRLSYSTGGWQLQDRIKTWQAELCGESTITSFLSILRFTQPGKRKIRTCLVFKDALGSEHYRRLIVILRTAKIH